MSASCFGMTHAYLYSCGATGCSLAPRSRLVPCTRPPLDIYFHNHHPFVLLVRCPRIFPVGSMILLRPHISSLGATFPTWLLETKNTEFFGARAGSTMSLKRMLSPQEGQAVGDRMICAPLMASMRLTSGNRMRSAPAPAAS